MNTISKPLSTFYFLSGLLVGLLIGVSLDKQWSYLVSRFISSGAIILLALFWQRIESFAHDHYLETWQAHKARGKWRFIFTHYVFVRGIILLVVTAGPMLPSLTLTTNTAAIILASIVSLVLLLVYLGHEAWIRCEQDYEILQLRQAAQQSRIASN